MGKKLIVVFLFLYKWLVWKMGDGKKVILGKDPLISGGCAYKLSTELIQWLYSKGLYYLHNIRKATLSQASNNYWLSPVEIGFSRAHAIE